MVGFCSRVAAYQWSALSPHYPVEFAVLFLQSCCCSLQCQQTTYVLFRLDSRTRNAGFSLQFIVKDEFLLCLNLQNECEIVKIKITLIYEMNVASRTLAFFLKSSMLCFFFSVFREIDIQTGYTTNTLLCMPIFIRGK